MEILHMKKLMSLGIVVFALSCKKDSNSNSDPTNASASYKITTEAVSNVPINVYPNDSLSCNVYFPASGTSSTWSFTFISARATTTVAKFFLQGSFPNNDISKSQPYSLSSKAPGPIIFSGSFAGSISGNNYSGDSCFLQLGISKYDSHLISGNFSFRFYQGAYHAIAENGVFTNVPVILH
jgi:hypothetical protein